MRQIFTQKGTSPTNQFCTDSYANKCLITLSLTIFTQRNFIADFLPAKCDFTRKTAVFVFWGLAATYDVLFGLIGKRVADFLLLLIELFC